MHTYVCACYCTRGLYEDRKRTALKVDSGGNNNRLRMGLHAGSVLRLIFGPTQTHRGLKTTLILTGQHKTFVHFRGKPKKQTEFTPFQTFQAFNKLQEDKQAYGIIISHRLTVILVTLKKCLTLKICNCLYCPTKISLCLFFVYLIVAFLNFMYIYSFMCVTSKKLIANWMAQVKGWMTVQNTGHPPNYK